MRLAIDVGNTLSKIAVFRQDELIYISRENSLTKELITKILSQYRDIRSAIIASVKKPDGNLLKLFPEHIPLTSLNHQTPLPISINYNTPETLGSDRIAAAVAANHLYPGKNVLVVESGTCITYDFIDAKGTFQGGSISPGMDMRYRAMHNFTASLPLLEPAKDPLLTGKTTNESMHSGVMNGIVAEIQGVISMYERNYENLTIILSGGNREYFDKNLKNNIFAVPNIVLTGLNVILRFNDKN